MGRWGSRGGRRSRSQRRSKRREQARFPIWTRRRETRRRNTKPANSYVQARQGLPPLRKDESHYDRLANSTDGEASNPGPRRRRRGPRSEEAQDKRRQRNEGISSRRVADAILEQARLFLKQHTGSFDATREESATGKKRRTSTG